MNSNLDKKGYCNNFVGYLNTLQRISGSNENALAEFQSLNKHFNKIQVKHPLSSIVIEELKSDNKRHVVITGHAGDGKTTIALEIFKELKRLPYEDVLIEALNEQESIDNITIIKDLSERNKIDDDDLIKSMKGNERKYLLISNTGTLMDLLCDSADSFDKSRLDIEKKVLDSIDTKHGEGFINLGDVEFRVFNLARLDNLGLARQIFENMLNEEHWNICKHTSCSMTCPIKANVDLINSNQQLILDRLFLIYRRMFEYGIRLTIRQFTEHFAYIITSGLEERDIEYYDLQGRKWNNLKFLFFNRFFGDDGISFDSKANKIKVIEEIKKQEFGLRPHTKWEHKLWLSEDDIQFENEIISDVFKILRREGAKAGNKSIIARKQIRRIIYFMCVNDVIGIDDYVSRFLNSPTILNWIKWQNENKISPSEKSYFAQKIFHVMQEHFTGLRLPETISHLDQRLYVTLNRSNRNIRQSAQIVLAQVNWNDSFNITLEKQDSIINQPRTDLWLKGKGNISDLDLELRLPFLDFVIIRHFGEIGELLHSSYLERIEKFKAKFQITAKNNDCEGITVIRLKSDNTFKQQILTLNEKGLEVSHG